MNILLIGNGKMSKEIQKLSTNIIGVYDGSNLNLSVVPDVVIDFSHPDFLDKTIDFGIKYKCPVIIGTTNYSDSDKDKIKNLSKTVPVIMSENYSIGINLLFNIFKSYKQVFNLFNSSVCEIHHNQKKDKPSGTAKRLGELLNTSDIYAIRTGNVVGTHEVFLSLGNETIRIIHEALSRDVFANGALNAAMLALNLKSGLYLYEDLIKIDN